MFETSCTKSEIEMFSMVTNIMSSRGEKGVPDAQRQNSLSDYTLGIIAQNAS